jgi:hypothetical protein
MLFRPAVAKTGSFGDLICDVGFAEDVQQVASNTRNAQSRQNLS